MSPQLLLMSLDEAQAGSTYSNLAHPRFLAGAELFQKTMTRWQPELRPTDLTGRRCTLAALTKAAAGIAKATADHTPVFLYYAGHGGDQERTGLVSSNGFITPADLEQAVSVLAGRPLTVVLDCCHAAGMVQDLIVPGFCHDFLKLGERRKIPKMRDTAPSHRVALLAARPQDPTGPGPDGLPDFTANLCQILEEDQSLTVWELMRRTAERCRPHVGNERYVRLQASSKSLVRQLFISQETT